MSQMRHGIKIPSRDKDQMMTFLQEGPAEGQPPAWVDWTAGVAVATAAAAAGSDEESSCSSDREDSDEEYLPFLHLRENANGQRCRCGSKTHLTVNAHACPLNPRNIITTPVDGDDDGPADAGPADAAPADAANDAASDDAASDDDTPDEHAAEEAVPAVTLPFRRPRTVDNSNACDPPPRRRRRGNYLKANAEVEVLYENVWWPATIKFKHRGDKGYAVKYRDDEECEEANVPADRIRPPET